MKLPIFIVIIFASVALALSPKYSSAIDGTTPLGGRCEASHDCTRNLGCRKSNLGDFFVCKITVPTASGCAVDLGENMCADGLVCADNRCLPTYGLEDLEDGKFVVPIEPPNENPVFDFPDDIGPISAYATISTARKILNTIFAAALLVGFTAVVKGILTYTTAIGFIPQERRGFALIGIGGAVVVLSIVMWLVV